jgi:WD40 repeat protein
MMVRMQLEALVNYQATLALPKIRLVALQNDAIRSGRVSLLSCGCPSSVNAVVTHADLSRQNLYISGCSDGSLGVWDRSKKALVRVQHTGIPICSLAVAPSGSFYAVGHETGMLSFWNCKDLLAGKEAPLKSMSSSSAAVLSQQQIGSSSYHLTLTLLAGCSSIPASYCRVTLVGDVAEASSSLFHSIDGTRTLQAGVPLVFKIVSPTWLGPLSKVTLAVDSIAADVRSMFNHVTVSCGDDLKFTFKPQGESAPAPSLTYMIADKSGTASQDFIVHVYTGGDFGAGTDSKITVIVKGIQGEARLALQHSLLHADPFERGHHDVFLFSLQPSERVGEVCNHTIDGDCWQPDVSSSVSPAQMFCHSSHSRYLTSPLSPRRAACFPSGNLITYRSWTWARVESTPAAHSSTDLCIVFVRIVHHNACCVRSSFDFVFRPRRPASLTCL